MGPDGSTTETEGLDVRSGGVWEFEMVGPDAETFPNRVVYDAVEEPNRLTYGHGPPGEPEPFDVTVSFEGTDDGGTELTMVMRFPSAAAFDEAAAPNTTASRGIDAQRAGSSRADPVV